MLRSTDGGDGGGGGVWNTGGKSIETIRGRRVYAFNESDIGLSNFKGWK